MNDGRRRRPRLRRRRIRWRDGNINATQCKKTYWGVIESLSELATLRKRESLNIYKAKCREKWEVGRVKEKKVKREKVRERGQRDRESICT